MCSCDLKVTIYRDIASIESLHDYWNTLLSYSAFPNIFLSWEWITVWWKWFGTDRDLYLITVSDKSEVLAIAPMYITNYSKVPGLRSRLLCLIGDGGPVCSDYLGPFGVQKNVQLVAEALVSALAAAMNDCPVVQLSDVLLDTGYIPLIRTSLNRKYASRVLDVAPCPYFSLPSSYEAFLSEISSNSRTQARRKLRKATKAWDMRFECFTLPQDMNRAFEIIQTVFNKSTRGGSGNHGFSHSDYRGFHREVAHTMANKGWVRIYVLWFGAVPVAYYYGFVYNNKFWFYQTAFDLYYSEFSPGFVALHLTIQSLIREGATEFDLLRGGETYKYHFASHERQLHKIVTFSNMGLPYLIFHSRQKVAKFARMFLSKAQLRKMCIRLQA